MSRPVIFISSVNRELRTTRDLVANTLMTLGYLPKWQDIAPTGSGDLKADLRKAIDESDAVIQLVGHCYGGAPEKSDLEFGSVSYSQYEALYAEKKQKPIFYIILEESNTVDVKGDETTLLKRKQYAYREKIRENRSNMVATSSLTRTEAVILGLRPFLRSVTLKPRIQRERSGASGLVSS